MSIFFLHGFLRKNKADYFGILERQNLLGYEENMHSNSPGRLGLKKGEFAVGVGESLG